MKSDLIFAHWRWLMAIVMLWALMPFSGWAEDGSQVVPGGGVITFTGATETNWVDNADGTKDFLIKFADTSTEGSFTFPGMTQARILAIGGGGGGAGKAVRGTSDTGIFGGPGGGGAGGLVETNSMFSSGTFTVNVGSGGAGGNSALFVGNACSGSNGGNTEIYQDAQSFITAYGGGGGGGYSAGLPDVATDTVGSGGGGSRDSSGTTKSGGQTLSSQGNNGGAGDKALQGGGGGGASASGDAASAGGKGGAGKYSNITGENVCYAGGGGGGFVGTAKSGSAISGGDGGGGRGGYAKAVAPEPGTEGLGGGGGGADSSTNVGAKGGSGVVYVRISGSLAGGLTKPTSVTYAYDGKEHTSYQNSPFYTVDGVSTATEIGVYTVTITPIEGLKWAGDENGDPVSVTMTIYAKDSKSGTEMVTGFPVSYIGAAEVTHVDDDLLIKFTQAGTFTLPGTTKARILAIGGGGGGAGKAIRGTSDTGIFGGPGGGGAGGFVETNSMFSSGTFTVNVGSGGAGGNSALFVGNACSGSNGGNTEIYQDAQSFITAYGGGGGGGYSAGLPDVATETVGSGGGGSRDSSGTTKSGGQTLSSQGNNGGAGDKALQGGGGGGASASGDAASAGGKGGAGKYSNITGENVCYAGGGGGGFVGTAQSGSAISGGDGGGGRGGYAKAVAPEPGTEGRGGGGGGADSSTNAGAKGGSGVVYVRISATMAGELVKPEKTQVVYYDGNAHTSVLASAFYELTGDNIGTNAGTYVAQVKLNDGYSWAGCAYDTDREFDVTLTIKQTPVTFTKLTMANYQYSPRPTDCPDPVIEVTPTTVKPIVEYADKKDAADSAWSTTKPTEVGTYWVRARIPDTTNYSGEPVNAQFTISKRIVTITDLFQKDWMEGTPDEAIPKPRMSVDPDWVAIHYQYAATPESPENEWSDTKPTTIATWAIRALPPNLDNYALKDDLPVTATFKIVKGRGGTFVDYVEIEIGGYSGDEALENFPYKLTFSEASLPGFLYSRAGEDGSELGFTDADGNDLFYRVDDWNTHGESVIYVCVPKIGKDAQTIRLYWKLREGATAPDHDPMRVFEEWTPAAAEKIAAPGATYDLVVRNGYRVNYWKVKPTLSKTVWAVGETAGVLTPGQLADGECLTNLINSVTGATVTFPPKVGGAYRYVFTLKDENSEYEAFESHLDFAVTASLPMDDLKGNLDDLTLNGRVMLANDDSAPGYEVTGQSYWRTDPETQPIYWVHSESHSATKVLPNMQKYTGSDHFLYARISEEKTNLLWRLENVILGNSFRNTEMEDEKCFLPWSPTGLGISSESVAAGTRDESGWMVLRNTTDAMIYSPCYTNGIGTIYFDAVNTTRMVNMKPENFAIAVEYATNVYNEVGESLPPTDENCRGETETHAVTDFGRLREEQWIPLSVIPLRRDNNAANWTRLAETNCVLLDIAKGGTTNNFFRICANLDYSKEVRFRIRRVGVVDGVTDLTTSFIAIDNIIVSYPKSTANLRPLGKFDSTKGGKQTLGQEGAFSVPFPAVEETEDVYGGATNEVCLSDAAKVDPKSLVLLSRMHYRWRYGNQASNEWQSVDLSPFDDFKATTPLKLPYDEGDLEFFYESFMNVPFYRYHDYSGASFGLGGLYTEETGVMTNRLNRASYAKFSGPGEDWFVRFRAGKSDWNQFTIHVEATNGCFKPQAQPMELIADHTWRGLVQVPTNATGIATVRINGLEHRSAWGELVESDINWYPKANIAKLPGRGETSVAKTEFGFELDGASTYVEFQFNDETGSFSVGHAEYQSFNMWHDAYSDDGTFVSQYPEKSGVNVVDMITTNAHIYTWSLHETENPNWNEPFELANYLDPDYPKYEFMLTHTTPNGWSGENGMFVDATLVKASNTVSTAADSREKGSGIAWQMRGGGLGSLSFTSRDTANGLDAVSFKARLAQTIDFNDFSVVDDTSSSSLQNYTFVVPAVMSASDYNDASPGSSMSVVGYYNFRSGGYEFRIDRSGTDGMLFSIYKWYSKGANGVQAELLTQKWYKDVLFKQNSTKPNMFAMFISVGEEDSDTTTIIGGLSKTAALPSQAFSNGTQYRLVGCKDSSSTRFKMGRFGVLSNNCNGWFVDPRHYTAYVGKAMASGSSSATFPFFNETAAITFGGTMVEDRDLLVPTRTIPAFAYTSDRAEYFEQTYNNNYVAMGIRAPQGMTQTVDVYLRDADDGTWAKYDSVTVSKYGFNQDPFTVTIRTNVDCHVMLKAGSGSSDVTVWQVKQTAWSGEDISPASDRDFIYTQARIIDEVSGTTQAPETNRYCALEPARVKSGKPLSIRSPLLNGLGMVQFSYKDVQPGAEVWVQIATNSVSGNLTGSGGYNQSILSMEPGGDEPEGTWVTLRKYTYDELAAASAQTHYIGLHDRIDNPLKAVIRIFVPPAVCETASAQAKTNPKYGAITITDIMVQDEPALNSRSWFGWNLRTVGDATDSERRMYLPDTSSASEGYETGRGLSAGLNNSKTANIKGDASKYDKIDPTIQSPTFGSYSTPAGAGQATIGQVSFRARLYDAEGTPATVSVYGAANSAETDWALITNFTVTSSRYKIFTYKAPSSKNYAAVRLAVKGIAIAPLATNPQRVLLDEVVVSEKSDTAVGFYYLRPFRTGLENDLVIDNILSKDQQPLSQESWGVQTKLKFDAFATDVDYDRGFRVTFRYFVGEKPWGWENWKDASGASQEVELKQVGSKSDYIFRSTAVERETIVPPNKANTVVQYAVTVYYYEKGNGSELDSTISVTDIDDDGWSNPDWYWPINKNLTETGGSTYRAATSPYTILDPIAPGRAWINEVNYNDGTKAETGLKYGTNQFIEIAVPSAVDMTGWKIRLTNFNQAQSVLAILGKNGLPSQKKTSDGRRSGEYEFLVLESPATKDAGGIRDHVTGEKAADGTWASTQLSSSSLNNGSLSWSQPYQLELVRPSGIVEHQFVLDGTNTYAYPNENYAIFGYQYDGTNLVNELDAASPSVKRFYAGSEQARKTQEATTLASLGVTGSAHGEEGGWSNEMRWTPGRLNEGQEALTGWYLPPSGGSCWVYLLIDSSSPHLSQKIGEDTSRDTFTLVNLNASTNVVYTASPWYQIDKVHRIENGVTNTTAVGQEGSYTYEIANVAGTTTIIATEAISSRLINMGLDPTDSYTPAVMRWLENGMANGKEFKNQGGEVKKMVYRDLNDSDDAHDVEIGLKGMYWFDVDPTQGGWWLRGGYKKVEPVQRTWYTNGVEKASYNNVEVDVTLYLSNDTDRVAAEVFAPKRLQGPNNEKSDDLATYTSWTGVTFKIEGALLGDDNVTTRGVGYLPMRYFVFGADSFDANYTTKIEIIDPFSMASPGYMYGWYDVRDKGYTPGYRWNIDEKLMPVGVEMLKADSTFEGKRPWVR